jgi:hypothetical protein
MAITPLATFSNHTDYNRDGFTDIITIEKRNGKNCAVVRSGKPEDNNSELAIALQNGRDFILYSNYAFYPQKGEDRGVFDAEPDAFRFSEHSTEGWRMIVDVRESSNSGQILSEIVGDQYQTKQDISGNTNAETIRNAGNGTLTMHINHDDYKP